MALLLSIILPIVIFGVGFGVLTAIKQAQRGFILWGGLLGIGIMVVVFLIPQYLYNWSSRLEFNKVGPCSVCGEWAFVPYLFYWGLWAIGGGIGLITIMINSARTFRAHPESFFRFPFPWRSFKKFIGFVAVLVGLLIMAIYLITETQNVRLIETINQISIPISNDNIDEIGRKGLPLEINFLGIQRSYVRPETLRFSPKGGFLEFQYNETTEIWMIRTMLPIHQFTSSYEVNTSFSPDESFLAAFTDPGGAGKLEIYRVGHSNPEWQMINGIENSYSPSFSFSVTLRYYGPEKEVFRYDYREKKFDWPGQEQKQEMQISKAFIDLQKERLSKPGEYLISTFSPDGQLAVFGWETHLEVWDLTSSEKIDEKILDAAITALAFSPDQHLLVIATADGYLRFFAQR